MIRRVVGLALLLAAGLSPRPAEASPQEMWSLALNFGLHVHGDGISGSIGARFGLMSLAAPVPLGGDLEVSWVFDRWVMRVLGSAVVAPREPLAGPECNRRAQIKARGEDIGGGPSATITAGGVVELFGPSPRFGGTVGAELQGYILSSHLRGLLLTDHGPELELGGGLRLPSIMGSVHVDVGCAF